MDSFLFKVIPTTTERLFLDLNHVSIVSGNTNVARTTPEKRENNGRGVVHDSLFLSGNFSYYYTLLQSMHDNDGFLVRTIPSERDRVRRANRPIGSFGRDCLPNTIAKNVVVFRNLPPRARA